MNRDRRIMQNIKAGLIIAPIILILYWLFGRS